MFSFRRQCGATFMHHFHTVSVNCLELGSSRVCEDTHNTRMQRGLKTHLMARCHAHIMHTPPSGKKPAFLIRSAAIAHARLRWAVSPINQINCNRSGPSPPPALTPADTDPQPSPQRLCQSS